MASSNSPAVPLYGYQKRWLADPSRFKCARWSRQTGKDFTSALEAVDDIAEHESRGGTATWILGGASQRQAKELARKVKMHAKAYQIAASDIGVDYFEGTEFKSFEIDFPGGSRVVTIPANTDTVAGFTGNVILTEFALAKNARELYRTVYGSITLGGLKMRIISTPRGKRHPFYEVCTNPAFSQHVVTIHDAIADGMPANAEELRAGLGSDEDGWRQEYLVEFLDEVESFITYEMILACESQLAGDMDEAGQGDLYVGIDVGRRHDLTVVWVDEAVGDVAWTREVVILRKVPFAAQREAIGRVLANPRVRRCEIDETGIGMNLAEDLQKDFGKRQVEAVTFSAKVKESLAFRLRAGFEDRLVRIPVDPDIRTDFHSVKKIVTAANNIRFDAETTDAGHADRFWAAALAYDAWKGGKGIVRGIPLNLYGRTLSRVA